MIEFITISIGSGVLIDIVFFPPSNLVKLELDGHLANTGCGNLVDITTFYFFKSR